MCKSNKVYTDLFFCCCFDRAHWACHTEWMHRTDNRKIIFGHSTRHIPVQVFIMKEGLELLIEEKWRKQYYFDTLVSAIEKIPSPNEKRLSLHQGNNFFDLHKTFFDNHYGKWIRELLPLSIKVTQVTASTFARWYLGVTEPDKEKRNIRKCEVHKYNVSTTRWMIFLDSLTINTKYFYGDQIVSHK